MTVPSIIADNPRAIAYRRRVLSERRPNTTPHMRALKFATTVSLVGLGLWAALFVDFGDRPHVFGPLRRWYAARRSEFLRLSDDENSSFARFSDIPWGSKRVCVALYDYAGLTEDELSFAAGDEFVVANSDSADWWYVRTLAKPEATGYVPSTYVRIVEERDRRSQTSHESDAGSELSQSPSDGSGSSSVSGSDNDSDSADEQGDTLKEIMRQQRLQRRKSRMHVNPNARRLVAPDAVDDAGIELPRGFGLSTLAKNLAAGSGRLKDFLVPSPDASGLSFTDLHLVPTPAKCTIAFSMLDARNVPASLNHLPVRGRHIRMALFDKTNILSNIHTVAAMTVDGNRSWRFSSKASLLFPKDDENTCFLRANDIDIKLCIFKSNQPRTIEVSCGWGILPLFTTDGAPTENKTYEIRLFGGSPFRKDDAFDEPMQRKGKLPAHQPKPPCLHIRVWKLGKDALSQLDHLPVVLMGHLFAVPVMGMYRQALVRSLVIQASVREPDVHLIYEPILAIFPRIAEQLDLFQLLATLWDRKLKSLKASDKKSPNKILRHFRTTVNSLWPMLSFWDMPEFRHGHADSLSMRAALISKLHDIGHVEFLSTDAAGVTFRPFDMSELVFMNRG
ncbi:hypothetical protein HK105_203701 [Polyrhizophydium stewartii]|uniref:SH3 domain-containing protein n=1 Tax=Polyrhizophydium stewartii TaxID=2732419 RepID=A0ABR4NAU6_9FUNG